MSDALRQQLRTSSRRTRAVFPFRSDRDTDGAPQKQPRLPACRAFRVIARRAADFNAVAAAVEAGELPAAPFGAEDGVYPVYVQLTNAKGADVPGALIMVDGDGWVSAPTGPDWRIRFVGAPGAQGEADRRFAYVVETVNDLAEAGQVNSPIDGAVQALGGGVAPALPGRGRAPGRGGHRGGPRLALPVAGVRVARRARRVPVRGAKALRGNRAPPGGRAHGHGAVGALRDEAARLRGLMGDDAAEGPATARLPARARAPRAPGAPPPAPRVVAAGANDLPGEAARHEDDEGDAIPLPVEEGGPRRPPREARRGRPGPLRAGPRAPHLAAHLCLRALHGRGRGRDGLRVARPRERHDDGEVPRPDGGREGPGGQGPRAVLRRAAARRAAGPRDRERLRDVEGGP